MPELPLKTQLLDSFLGLQEGIHSIVLPDLYSSGGSQNLYIDKFGRARSILGYAKANSTAITTDTGGDAVSVVGLHAYRSLAAGGDTRRLRAVVDDGDDEWEVWGSSDNGGTWSLLKDFGNGPVGYLSSYAQFGDEGYLANGVSAVQVDDGSSLADAGGTQSPTPSAAAGSAGSLAGNYQYRLVSMVGGTRQLGSAASTSVALDKEQADLTWTADTNMSVTGYELYRTSGQGRVYYFVDYIDGRTTAAYTDNLPDRLLLENRILEEHGDPPPTGTYYLTTHLQRMWYGRTDSNPRILYNSDPGDADSVYQDLNVHDLTDADSIGDKLTGILGGFEHTLVAFLERSVWTISGTGQIIGDVDDWIRTRTNARVGCVSHRAFQRVPAGATYTDQKGNFQRADVATLAYFTPYGDIRLFDGDNDLIISYPVKETLGDLNFSQRGTVISWSDPVRDEIGWIIPVDSDATPSVAVVWNHAFGVWYVRTPYPFQAILSTDLAAEGEVLFAGQADSAVGGYVYRLWSGATFDGTAIPVQWMTKTLFGVDDAGRPDMSSVKQWRWIELLTQESAGVTFDVEWVEGNTPDTSAAVGARSISPETATLLSSDGNPILATGGEDIMAALATSVIRVYLQGDDGRYLYNRGLRLRIKAEANQGQWAIEGLNLAYKTMPGLNRGVNP